MASAAQFEANRLNAVACTGKKTPEGKARSSRNHLKFGLFSTQNCVRPALPVQFRPKRQALLRGGGRRRPHPY